MKLNIALGACVVALATVSCGKEQKREVAATETPAAKAETVAASEAAPAEQGAAPQMLVTKVPLNLDGTEMHEQAETRELAKATDVADEANAAQVFEAGQKVTMNDSLDEGSAQQWGWGGSYCGNKYYYKAPSYSYSSYTSYTPSYTSYNNYASYGNYGSTYLYWGGYNYGYGCKQKYTYNNSNYYVYGSAYNYGYNSYGKGNGYGYGY